MRTHQSISSCELQSCEGGTFTRSHTSLVCFQSERESSSVPYRQSGYHGSKSGRYRNRSQACTYGYITQPSPLLFLFIYTQTNPSFLPNNSYRCDKGLKIGAGGISGLFIVHNEQDELLWVYQGIWVGRTERQHTRGTSSSLQIHGGSQARNRIWSRVIGCPLCASIPEWGVGHFHFGFL